VYNLSLLSRLAAEELLTKKNGKLCALLYVRKDGSIMNSDCPVGLTELRKRIMRRVSGVVAAIFALLGLGQVYMNYRHAIDPVSPVFHQVEQQGTESQMLVNEKGEEIVVIRTMGVVVSNSRLTTDE